MGKQKRARNLKVIGEGSYGCVHRPSLKCKTPPTRRFNYGNYISKTLKTRDAQNELEEYNKLQDIDPKNQYHLGKPILCHPAPTKETIQSLNKCRDIEVVDIKNDAKNYSLLISKYGGEDVHKFFKNSLATFLSKNRQKKVDHILMSIYNLLNGIQTFRDNDLVHYDIKPQNILFNKKTFEMKYIDFGLMNNKTTIIQDSNDSENWLGIYHWSYPFECGLMNKNKFYEYANLSLDEKQMYKSTFIDSILSKRRSHLIKHPDSFELLFAYIDPLYEVPNNEIQYTYMKSFFEGMDAVIHTNSYEEILNKITDSIDLFGLGVSIQLMINFLKSQNALDERIYMDISSLCKKMYHFNLQERVTDVQLLLDEYSTILVKHDVYKRLKKKQQRHRSIPVKQGKHVSAKLSNKAYLDPYEWNTNKTRRPPKMHKNKSRRRIQI